MGVIWALGCAVVLAAEPMPTEYRVEVLELARAKAFYEDVLGFSPIFASEEMILIDAGAFRLKLVPARKVVPSSRALLTFQIENPDRRRRQLTVRGGQPGPLSKKPWGRGFSIRDPDGHRIDFQNVVRGEWKKNIEYARYDKVSLGLDVFVPEAKGPHPAVLVVHGGGFTGGDRQTSVLPLLELLSGTHRYTVFTLSYRLSPKHRYPKAVEDVQQALRFVREHASAYKVDPARVALMGESAGGYLVSMASTRLREQEQVQAVVALYGAHDLPARVQTQGQIASSMRSFLGVGTADKNTLNVLARASPVTWVRQDAPPHLLIHGTEDEQVPYSQSTKMCGRMEQLKALCRVLAVEGGRHGLRGWDMDVMKTHYKDALLEFLDKHVLATTLPPAPLQFVNEEPGQ